jgi:hypothetical protein
MVLLPERRTFWGLTKGINNLHQQMVLCWGALFFSGKDSEKRALIVA